MLRERFDFCVEIFQFQYEIRFVHKNILYLDDGGRDPPILFKMEQLSDKYDAVIRVIKGI